jgi:AcrR family transcriptional regulator
MAISSQDPLGRIDRRNHSADRISSAALRLFYIKGFKATSMRDIAKRAGITPGAIYNHFPSKQEILYTVIRAAHAALDEEIEQALNAVDADPKVRLATLVRVFVLRHARFPDGVRVANRDFGSLPRAQREEILEIRRGIRALFQHVLQDGEAAGQMTLPHPTGTPVDVELLAMAIVNMIVMISEWYRPKGRLSAEEVADAHAAIILQMVGVAPTDIPGPKSLAGQNPRRRPRVQST